MRQTAKSFSREFPAKTSINYLLYLPDGYQDKEKSWPLILFLHGSGERGTDLEIVKRNGIPKIVEEVKDFPFITISPQCPEDSSWGEQIEILMMLLAEIEEKYQVNPQKLYLTGLSLGGYGTLQLAAQYPKRFAAIAPVCGGGDPKWAPLLKDIPIWAFHGAKDDIVPVEQSQKMVRAIKKLGGNIRLTVYPDAGHDSWVNAYNDPRLYEWFLEFPANGIAGTGTDLKILEIDPFLNPYKKDLELRLNRYLQVKESLLGGKGKFKDFANGYNFFGFQQSGDGWYYREWAPAAEALFLIGDFNNWNRESHPLRKTEEGSWEIFLPGKETLPHKSRVKVRVKSKGTDRDRIPLYIKKVTQDPRTRDFSGQIWAPEEAYQWSCPDFRIDSTKPPLIYETHVGMAQEKEGIGTYKEFEENILPRVKALGYNTIQIMAIMEHPYYASFGYHVSNYFAASSWFGTPEELKSLIDKAHSMGIAVLMDIVHSHAVKNLSEGINEFDGTVYQFFHPGSRGDHIAWDSKLFNYGKHEVIHFLLSSIKFWLEEYHFDGFRFDGVTSMIYHDHGLGTAFNEYGRYFSLNTDLEAITYLQFANELIREIRPDALSIAEDMSGMPGMCLPVEDGGIGFDYRLAMGMPDYWVNTLKLKDEDWDMGKLWYELATSRPLEKRIGYVESHDQALVGDKTLIFRMADKEMYWYMNKESQSLVVERAIALHKMIRLITISLGSEGYLNFMGNEFGHPEWIDFPREGNGWSFKYCRRQWSLADSKYLRYYDLNLFDSAMIHLVVAGNLMGGGVPQSLCIDQERKIIAFRKKDFLYIFNFHPTESYPDFALPIHEDGCFQVVLDTDEQRFGGQGRICHATRYVTAKLNMNGEFSGIPIYSPSRTAMILQKI
ncbi:MAG TPA: alpha-amylase family glycosyl hydrolase [Desulfitobacteriaceae bacterium]|nr:alpha-amylase family glycosyl hydrolase [Desulfitobacteriaceae bacterium]